MADVGLGQFVVLDTANTRPAAAGVGVNSQPFRGAQYDGDIARRHIQPFGNAERIGYQVQVTGAMTVQIRGGATSGVDGSTAVTPVVLASLVFGGAGNQTAYLNGPLPYVDANISAHAAGEAVAIMWGKM